MGAGNTYTPSELAAALHRKALAARDGNLLATRCFPLILKLLQSQTKKAFHNQASPEGAAWPGLAHTRARGTSGHVLRDTSELMASLTANGHPDGIGRLDGTRLIYGTASIKGFHNRGGMIQAKNARFLTIPASKEALYAGGMRNFPRKLQIAYNDKTGSGIAFEKVARKQRQKSKTKAAKKKRAKKSWLGKKLDKAKKLAKAFLKRLLKRRRRQKARRTGPRAQRQRKSLRQRRGKWDIVIHYFLKAFVIVPQREFLVVSQDTQEKAGKIVLAMQARIISETQ